MVVLDKNMYKIEKKIETDPLNAEALLEEIFAPLKERNGVPDISVRYCIFML